MTSALWYLLRTSARNQVRRQLRRVRNPRYAAALVVGIAYLWLIFLRPGSHRPANGLEGPDPVLLVLLPTLVIGMIAWAWIVGADRSALAFTQAEVAMLFPAPLTRRALILFKLARSQLSVLISMLLWVVILRRGGGALPGPLRAIALWSVFSTLSLHRLGVALLRSGATEHGRGGLRRGAPAMIVFSVMLGAVGFGLWQSRADLSAAPDPAAFLRAVFVALQLPPASIALFPFTLVFAPLMAATAADWLAAIGPALLMLALHAWWVLGSHAAFEESAAEASVRMAKRIADLRARHGGLAPVRTKAIKRSLPLRPTGAPAVAILWKNSLWLLRTGHMRGLLLPAAIALAATLAFARGSGPAGTVIVSMSLLFAGLYFVFGPMALRNDLRNDLLNLPLLKTLPLVARDVVLAEVASGAGALTVAQALLGLVAALALTMGPETATMIPDGTRLALLLGAPVFLFALNGVTFTLHNGAALLFPGWVRLGEHGAAGIAATGQMMITGVAMLLALALLLILPAAAAFVVSLALQGLRDVAIFAALLVAAAVLAVEIYVMLIGLGRAYDKVEPMQVV